MKSKKIIGIAVAACLVLLLSGVGIGALMFDKAEKAEDLKKAEEPKKADPLQVEKDYQKLQTQVRTNSDDPNQYHIDFKELHAINQDIYAWIRIPGTNVDYPILQSTEESDEYYLNTTMDKQQGLPGSIYTEKYNRTTFQDPVTVIYGHTLNEGTMFTELHNYTDRSFFDANPYIYIYLPDKTFQYQIFAAVAFDDRYILGSYSFTDTEDFNKYVSELKGSMSGNINKDIAVDETDKVITLSTCIDEFPDQRWLVSAVRLDQE